jgi:uncharacterized protein (TIGR00255 family)
MALASMTGFGRADGSLGAASWHWEIRSVNGRGLDLRLKLPAGTETLEIRARERLQKLLVRGSVTATLALRRQTSDVEIRLNERVLSDVVRIAERVRALTGGEALRPEALLAIKGVLDVVEVIETEEEAGRCAEAILASLDAAIGALLGMRKDEGARLAAVITDHVGGLERLVEDIACAPGRRADAVSHKIKEAVARIQEAGPSIDPTRLYQEAVLIATRADVEEELNRLRGHAAAVRELIAGGGAVGRKLDFLAQELYREANTLCSKSSDAEVTRLGLSLKSIVDQLREQVQNIE